MPRQAQARAEPDELVALEAAIINGRFEMVDAESIETHPENPRQGDIGAIYESIMANGFYGALLCQESTRHILTGNHRYKAGRMAGMRSFPVFWVDVDDQTALKIMLADNRTSDLATNDLAQLSDLLRQLDDAGQLRGTGYEPDDIDQLLEDLDRQQEDEDTSDDRSAEGRDGALLALADIAIKEPSYVAEKGDVWMLGDHVLLICDVHDDWETWQSHLEGDAMFVPYPGFYAALSESADHRKYVMVQPDTYIAGHILDKYASIKGQDAVRKILAE